jgi:hypothetical protein
VELDRIGAGVDHGVALNIVLSFTIDSSVQNNTPISFFSNSSSDIMVSASGTIGASVAPTRRRSASRLIGDDAHVLHHPKLFPEIGEGLDVGAADQRFIRRRAAAQPLGIELAHVAFGQHAVFARSRALWPAKAGA